MTPESVMTLGRKAMEVTLMVSAPMLLVALVDRPGGQHLPGRHPDQRNDPVLHPQAGRPVRHAGGGRAVDAVGDARLHAAGAGRNSRHGRASDQRICIHAGSTDRSSKLHNDHSQLGRSQCVADFLLLAAGAHPGASGGSAGIRKCGHSRAGKDRAGGTSSRWLSRPLSGRRRNRPGLRSKDCWFSVSRSSSAWRWALRCASFSARWRWLGK